MNAEALARVRDLLAIGMRRGVFPGALPARPLPFLPPPPVAGIEAMTAVFRERLEALGGTVHVAVGAEKAAQAAAAIARKVPSDERLFTAWFDDPLAGAVAAALAAEGWRRIGHAESRNAADRTAHGLGLARCALGITGADAALASTGSLVLHTGQGRGRLTSLLPPVHIALVPAGRLVWDLAHWLHANPRIDQSSNLVIVTGPSRTADIEMTLTRGVHGPRDVHVVLVNDGG
jgi:L-lactate dehydrogenase complex protein LldG